MIISIYQFCPNHSAGKYQHPITHHTLRRDPTPGRHFQTRLASILRAVQMCHVSVHVNSHTSEIYTSYITEISLSIHRIDRWDGNIIFVRVQWWTGDTNTDWHRYGGREGGCWLLTIVTTEFCCYLLLTLGCASPRCCSGRNYFGDNGYNSDVINTMSRDPNHN